MIFNSHGGDKVKIFKVVMGIKWDGYLNVYCGSKEVSSVFGPGKKSEWRGPLWDHKSLYQ